MPTGAGTRTWDIGPWAASHFGPSIFTFLGTTLSFDYLRTRTDTKYLARPRIITLNNETAEIRIATNEAIGLSQSTTSTGGTGTTTSQAERTETGVILRVTPQINAETGEVTMFVFPKVADASHTTTISAGTAFPYTFKDPEERSTKQVVKVKDGETIVIGGLIRNQSTTVVKKLPVLGDLPLVGGAFRHISKTPNEERELMVFITPHLVKDTKATAVAQLPVGKQAPVPQREQSTASAANSRQSAISKYIKNFEQ
jgi:type II secretory pathway component GspD/PulD (secretin)